jgi:biotin-(acetyl-CoA carboxylase) ligase
MAILTFDTIDSTNNYLKLHADSLPHFTIVRARFQHAGRGQLVRQWQSNPFNSMPMSKPLSPLLSDCVNLFLLTMGFMLIINYPMI